MADSKWFRAIAFILTTAAFGYLGWLLYDAIQTGFLFLNNDDSYTLEGVLIMVPLALTILWSIIYHRYIWIGGVACVVLCAFINSGIGDVTSPEHIPLFVASVAVPYLLCSFGILHDPYRSVPSSTSSTSSSTYIPTVSDYPSTDDTPSGPFPMSYAEMHDYIQTNFDGEYSYGAISRIENDPTLTPAQKEDLKIHLRAWGD